jgi:hypothetical protein
MNNKQPRPPSWLFPVCVAVSIIVAFSLLSHSPPGARPGLKSTPRSGESGGSHAAAKAGALDLGGVIKGADGRPVTNASVFIYTAQPRSGPGFL